MKTFEPKVIYVDNEAIDKNMNVLSNFCKSMNDLCQEFEKTIGYKPDVETLKFLMLNDNKEIYPIIQRVSTGLSSTEYLDLPEYKTPEKLIDFIKECYVKHRTDVDSIKVAGIKLNFSKMLGMVDYPSFDEIFTLLRRAIMNHYVVFGRILKKLVKEDLSNIFEKGAFKSELLRGEIEAYFTVKTETEEDNELLEFLKKLCSQLNALKHMGYKLERSYRGVGTLPFDGIDDLIDYENNRFIVSKHMLDRKLVKTKVEEII